MSDDPAGLLTVQELDTAADVLRHRLETLPERAELAARHEALRALAAEVAPIEEQRRELMRAQKALEDEIAMVTEKTASVDKAMYGSGASNPRELQAMQDDIDSLKRRRSYLEDQVLERMIQAEPLDAQIEAFGRRRAAIDEDAIRLTASVAESEAAIGADLADLDGRRSDASGDVDAGLLERYEKLRLRFKGVGVARLEGNRCTGCHLALPAAEVEIVKREAREDGIATCPQCDRLLVVD
jgi:predicted  nucleic acid-binding Zn-ribbon protein